MDFGSTCLKQSPGATWHVFRVGIISTTINMNTWVVIVGIALVKKHKFKLLLTLSWTELHYPPSLTTFPEDRTMVCTHKLPRCHWSVIKLHLLSVTLGLRPYENGYLGNVYISIRFGGFGHTQSHTPQNGDVGKLRPQWIFSKTLYSFHVWTTVTYPGRFWFVVVMTEPRSSRRLWRSRHPPHFSKWGNKSLLFLTWDNGGYFDDITKAL